MPKVPTKLLKCSFYLYASEEDALAGKNYGGSGFFVGIPSISMPGQFYPLAVSNWHVACRRGFSVIRVNKIGGGVDVFDLQPDQWEFVPNGPDIAVTNSLRLDQSIHDISLIEPGFFLTEEKVASLEIGPGEDVFMAGKFMDHDGGGTNKPALRFGHISMMPEPMLQFNGAMQPSYCVDVHSRTGFSGSPVFAFRTGGQDLERPSSLDLTENGKLFVGLLGIHWGQFPEFFEASGGSAVSENEAKNLVPDGYRIKGLSGMTCVAPVEGILQATRLPKIQCPIEGNEKLQAMQQALGLTHLTPVHG